MSSWHNLKNILCIRPDNMGDLIMSAPAIRALKQSFNAKITVLTSSMAAGIAGLIPEIDETIVFDLPWVKTNTVADPDQVTQVVDSLKSRHFDGAVIFTVFSQNPMPAAMLTYLAGIPRVLAYCRENPYQLLTDWVPDKEPYELIRHQVRRDLDLVSAIGAKTDNEELNLTVEEHLWPVVEAKLAANGVNTGKPWFIFHAGVSESKREYPFKSWVVTARQLVAKDGTQVLFTGSSSEKTLTDRLAEQTGTGAFSVGGLFNLSEFVCLIKHVPLMVSVNTGTTHIAAAVKTPVVVLYAETNPQHTPWNALCKVLYFPVKADLSSKNEVIRFVNKTCYQTPAIMPGVTNLIDAINELLNPPHGAVQSSRDTLRQNPVFSANR